MAMSVNTFVTLVYGTLLLVLSVAAKPAEFVEGELLVKFKPTVGSDRRAQVLGKLGFQHKKDLTSGGWAVYKIPKGKAVSESKAQADLENDVEYSEPNLIYRHFGVPNDPEYTNGRLWGTYSPFTAPSNSFGSRAAQAWANGVTDCSSVYVGVVDSGVMNTHNDLADNMRPIPGEIPGNGADDNGNGLVDDAYGWNFVGTGRGNGIIWDAGSSHGTHVAGTIGAVGSNGRGTTGVCWRVNLIAARFMASDSGSLADAVEAIRYLVALKTRGVNVRVINASWGSYGFSQALYDAIREARDADILFVAAAGNEANNNDATPSYPSSYDLDNIISVAAIDSVGRSASFTNFGATAVDIGAPGVGILSTDIAVSVTTSGKGRRRTTTTTITPSYSLKSGTSMAAPHVAGAAALYAATKPGATYTQIKNAILSSAVPTASLAGRCVTGGRLDVFDMLSK